MITVYIVDDEPSSVELLTDMISEQTEIAITGSSSIPEQAIEDIKIIKPDLLFLDIQLGNMTGFDLLSKLHEANFKPAVIFVTAYDQFAIEALRNAAIDYLLKPVDEDQLKASINRYREAMERTALENKIDKLLFEVKHDNRIRINTRSGYLLFKPDDILYAKADGNYSEIYTTDGNKEVVCLNLTKFESLLNSQEFQRINRSLLINEKYLRKVDRKTKVMTLQNNNQVINLKISGVNYSI
jgi:two-component system, LytTR family, response regulator